MCWHQISPFSFPSSSSSSTNLTSFITQIQIHIPHKTWPAQEVHESKIDHTNVIYQHNAEPEAHKSAEWVGIKTHTHIFSLLGITLYSHPHAFWSRRMMHLLSKYFKIYKQMVI